MRLASANRPAATSNNQSRMSYRQPAQRQRHAASAAVEWTTTASSLSVSLSVEEDAGGGEGETGVALQRMGVGPLAHSSAPGGASSAASLSWPSLRLSVSLSSIPSPCACAPMGRTHRR